MNPWSQGNLWSACIIHANDVTYSDVSFDVLHPYSIPANTAIYQSAAAFVFIISVPLLRERVTLIKVGYGLFKEFCSYPVFVSILS